MCKHTGGDFWVFQHLCGMKAPVKGAEAGTGAEGFFEMVVWLFFYCCPWIFMYYICANPQVQGSSILLCVHVWMIAVYNRKPCSLIWGAHALLGAVSWQGDSLQWLEPANAQRCAALLAGQSIHSGNQKQGLRKWVLSEVTSQWGCTCSRSGKARTRTMGLWECAESCRGPMGPEGWCITLVEIQRNVAHAQQGVSACKMVGERWNRWGGRSGGYWVLLLDESGRGLGTCHHTPQVNFLSETPQGTGRMAWWNRRVRTESLSCFTATFV